MKKWNAILLTCVLLFTYGCSVPSEDSASTASGNESLTSEQELLQRRRETAEDSDEVTEITEKLFTQQINFIYYNPDEYLGKSISYEGIFDYYMMENGEQFAYVFRYGPGCCANDANVGFEVYRADEAAFDAKANDWVKVTGTVQHVYHDGLQYLALELTEFEVMEERGAETVT